MKDLILNNTKAGVLMNLLYTEPAYWSVKVNTVSCDWQWLSRILGRVFHNSLLLCGTSGKQIQVTRINSKEAGCITYPEDPSLAERSVGEDLERERSTALNLWRARETSNFLFPGNLDPKVTGLPQLSTRPHSSPTPNGQTSLSPSASTKLLQIRLPDST